MHGRSACLGTGSGTTAPSRRPLGRGRSRRRRATACPRRLVQLALRSLRRAPSLASFASRASSSPGRRPASCAGFRASPSSPSSRRRRRRAGPSPRQRAVLSSGSRGLRLPWSRTRILVRSWPGVVRRLPTRGRAGPFVEQCRWRWLSPGVVRRLRTFLRRRRWLSPRQRAVVPGRGAGLAPAVQATVPCSVVARRRAPVVARLFRRVGADGVGRRLDSAPSCRRRPAGARRSGAEFSPRALSHFAAPAHLSLAAGAEPGRSPSPPARQAKRPAWPAGHLRRGAGRPSCSLAEARARARRGAGSRRSSSAATAARGTGGLGKRRAVPCRPSERRRASRRASEVPQGTSAGARWGGGAERESEAGRATLPLTGDALDGRRASVFAPGHGRSAGGGRKCVAVHESYGHCGRASARAGRSRDGPRSMYLSASRAKEAREGEGRGRGGAPAGGRAGAGGVASRGGRGGGGAWGRAGWQGAGRSAAGLLGTCRDRGERAGPAPPPQRHSDRRAVARGAGAGGEDRARRPRGPGGGARAPGAWAKQPRRRARGLAGDPSTAPGRDLVGRLRCEVPYPSPQSSVEVRAMSGPTAHST
jgi:hypothetical protein